MRRILLAGLLGACASLAHSFPDTISYQGRVFDKDGQPVSGAVDVTFRLYASSEGGSALAEGWQDSDSVNLMNGVYSTEIGDPGENPVPIGALDSAEVWLSITIEGEELLPRKQLQAVPYAFRSQAAGQVTRLFETAGDVTRGTVAFLRPDGTIVSASGRRESGSQPVGEGDVCSGVLAVQMADGTLVFTSRRCEIEPSPIHIQCGRLDGYSITLGPIATLPAEGYVDGPDFLTRLDDDTIIICYSDHATAGSQKRVIAADVTPQQCDFSKYTSVSFIGVSSIYSPLPLSSGSILFRYTKSPGPDVLRIGQLAGPSINFTGTEVESHAIPIAEVRPGRVLTLLGPQLQFFNIHGIDVEPDNQILPPSDVISVKEAAVLNPNTLGILYANQENQLQFRIGYMDDSASTVTFSTAPLFIYTKSSNPMRLVTRPSLDFLIAGVAPPTPPTKGLIWFRVGVDPGYNPMILAQGILAEGTEMNDLAAVALPGGRDLIYHTRSTFAARLSEVTILSEQPTDMAGIPIGIVLADAPAQSMVPVALVGISDVHSGMLPSVQYYANPDGTLTPNVSPVEVGKAISESELLIDIEP